MPLVDASQLSALREIGDLGLVDDVVIQKQIIVPGAEGDDVSTWVDAAHVKGWVLELTPQPTIQQDVGGIQGVPELFRLFVPVGTDGHAGYRASVNGSPWYTVEHTSDEDTFPVFLTLTMRKLTE